jgi:protein required for attachment to host cells
MHMRQSGKQDPAKRTMHGASPASEPSPRLWAVVSDGRNARVYRKEDDGNLALLDRITSTRSHHQRHNPPHIEDIHPDDAAFIKDVGKWLHDFSEGDAFDKFVLVASPKMLPHFRNTFSPAVQSRMMAEVGKDIAHLEDKEVCKELCDIMWF